MVTGIAQTTMPNRPIRLQVERAIREERLPSLAELARRLDMGADPLRWCLGYPARRDRQRRIDREIATRIIREIGVDPLDVGL